MFCFWWDGFMCCSSQSPFASLHHISVKHQYKECWKLMWWNSFLFLMKVKVTLSLSLYLSSFFLSNTKNNLWTAFESKHSRMNEFCEESERTQFLQRNRLIGKSLKSSKLREWVLTSRNPHWDSWHLRHNCIEYTTECGWFHWVHFCRESRTLKKRDNETTQQ